MTKKLEIGVKNEFINSRKKAFTILEVLMVVALIGLIAGLFALNFDVLIRSIGKKRPEKVLYNVICEARYQTIKEHTPVYLSFDKSKNKFIIFKEKAGKPLVEMKMEPGVEIVFESIPPNTYRGAQFQKPPASARETLEKIAFFPDSSSTPVTITLIQGDFSLKYKPDTLSCGMSSV